MMSRPERKIEKERAVKHFQKKSGIVPYLVVAVVIVLVYANAIDGAFVFDDKLLLQDNPETHTFERLAGHFTGKEGYHETMGRYYRPLVALTFCLDNRISEIYGNEQYARVFHLTNIIIHVIATMLLLRILVLLCRSLKPALPAALLFAVHPVHTEAVTWISGRTDSLACVFYLAAGLCWIQFTRRGGRWRIGLLFLFFAAALLCKEMSVTFPLAVVLYDLTAGRDRAPPWPKRIPAYAGLAALTVLFLVWREIALSHVGGRESLNYFFGKEWITTAATMLQTLPVYARLMVAPVDLLYHYNGVFPYLDSFLAGGALLGLGLLVVSGAAAIACVRRAPAVTFAICFFYLALLPVMNIVPTLSLMAERFAYIPSIALSILVAALLGRKAKTPAWAAPAFAVLCWAAIGLCAYLTQERNPDWTSNDKLYLSAEGHKGTKLSVNLGNYYARRNQEARAEALYREAIAIESETTNAWLNLGVLYMQKSENQQKDAARAAQQGFYDRADQMRRKARALKVEAKQYVERAHGIDPLSSGPLWILALINQALGSTGESIDSLEKLLEIEPDNRQAAALLKKLK